MKIISSVALALITGIVCSTYALKDMQSICLSNGGPQAVEDLAKFVTNLTTTCPTSVLSVNLWNFAEYATICEKSGTFLKCAVGLADMAKICGRSDQRELFEVGHKAITAAHNYVCDNEKYIMKIYSSPDSNCPSTKALALIHCFGKYLLGTEPQDFDQVPREMIHPTTLLLNIDPDFKGKTCSNLQKFEKCGVEVMAECKDKEFSKLLESVFKYVNNDIPCENLSKTATSNSQALLGSVVNVLLLFYTVITMSF